MRLIVIAVDFLNDFCEQQPGKAALKVDNADKAALNFAKFVKKEKGKIDEIMTINDSHHLLHIAHPISWVNSRGQHPDPFITTIEVEDVEKGVWRAYNPAFQQRYLNYVRDLRKFHDSQKRKTTRGKLTIWNPHCLILTWGQCTYPPVQEALMEWENLYAMVDIRTKGSNPFSEHYSGIMADVPDPSDHTTQLDLSKGSIIDCIDKSDITILTGIAGSHCLANTGFDIVDFFPNESYKQKLIIFEDCIAPVKGYEKFQEDFLSEMISKGIRVTTSDKF